MCLSAVTVVVCLCPVALCLCVAATVIYLRADIVCTFDVYLCALYASVAVVTLYIVNEESAVTLHLVLSEDLPLLQLLYTWALWF